MNDVGQEQPLRRVAVLMSSLGPESRDRLLQCFPEELHQPLRQAVTNLQGVDRQEQRAAIQEFLNAGEEDTTLTPRSVKAKTEATMDRASERLIAECLCDEMPQAIAVALSQLPTEKASEVVSYLPATVQAHVLQRLVELDTNGELELSDVREEFQLWLSQQIERSMHRAELAARLAKILDATHQGTRDRILSNVADSDSRLASELKLRFSVSPPD